MDVQINRLPPSIGITFRVALLLAMALAACRIVLVSCADWVYRRGGPGSVEKAAALLPSNAAYHYANALLLEQNEPKSPEIEQEFAAAVNRNPRYSDALLAWSVEKELRGDKHGAEQLLQQARSIDHLVRPAWALANFYYRQGNIQRFLEYSRDALEMIGISRISDGRFNPTPIFNLFWQSGASASDILKLGIPDVPVIRDNYLDYLITNGHGEYAPAAAQRILPFANKYDLFFLRPYMEFLIGSNQIELAAQTWQTYFEHGVVPLPGPDPKQGRLLTNTNLSGAPLDFGFDWRRIAPEAIPFEYSRVEHAYRFTFDGSEPEHVSLLLQVVPIEITGNYRFTSHFESDIDTESAGLRWRVQDHRTKTAVASRPEVSPQDDAKILTMDFTVPSGVNAVELVLQYNREPGTAPIRGFYQLLGADLHVR